jgi:hypothetical protein
MAITSKEINLSQLSRELGNKSLVANFNDPKKKLILPAEDVELTEDELKEAIANHIAVDDKAIKQAQRQAILDRIGLTADELQTILG